MQSGGRSRSRSHKMQTRLLGSCVSLFSREAAAAGWFGRGTPSTASDSEPVRWLRIAFPAGEQLSGWLPALATQALGRAERRLDSFY
jgi:hypothetical protein